MENSATTSLEHIPDDALEHLAEAMSSLEPESPPIKSSNLLITACAAIFAKLELNINVDKIKLTQQTIIGQLNEIVDAAKLRLRRIMLDADWWKQDHGHLLLFTNDKFTPHALISNQDGHYIAINSATGTKHRMNAELAKSFSPLGFMFYRTLPSSKLSLRDILHFSLHGNHRDLARLLYFQLCITTLVLLIPIITGKVMARVIPQASYTLLWQFLLALLVNTIVIGLFRISEMIAAIRFDLKINATLTPALWDRLLHFDLSFFRNFTAGDLVNRAQGIDDIQRKMNITIFLSIINIVISLFTFIIMYYYDKRLTIIAFLMTVIYGTVFLLLSLKQVSYQRLIQDSQGKLSGILFQFITAIAKLKVSCNEKNAFKRWNHDYAEQIRLTNKAGRIGYILSSFAAFYGILITICLFIGTYFLGSDLPFGVFIIYNGLYAQFFNGLLGLINAVTIITSIIPSYQRVKPILIQQPELEPAAIVTQPLRGQIELQHISFRYHDNLPRILDSVTLVAQPGDFIGITGASGSGKSTLFRILLGLEKQTSGLVLYDEIAIEKWNKIVLRKQIGVVLQQTMLFPGTILDNIIGAHDDMTIDDAWQAATLTEFATDIAAMPMNMHTLVSENGKSLSAGQRQRLLLARALAHKPKILFLDEATSAIDNETQAKIWSNISQQNITRIVSAHRLETVKDATFILHLG